MTRDFAGKTVVVTGAAGGLGRSLCLRFAAAGAGIAASDLDEAGLAELARTLTVQDKRHSFHPCDVTDAAACAKTMADVVARHGRIDVLINNAGISHRSAFAVTRLEVLHRVMDVNFWGAVNATKAALPALTQSKGLIVTISSIAGFAPLIGRTGYAASKHALHGFFDSLRSELQDDGVDVTIVCPSFIATGIDRAALGGDGRSAARPRRTTGREAAPEEAADAIFEAAARGQNLLLFSGTSKAAWWLSRLWPRRYAATMRKRLKSEIA
ncbi:SDR family oxidoreductase [Bradyrhizobium sp.]|uniref:SDR family oxidoreductase n=1 Tax=Bradyrhizobium sp. TaxID=376 RepID=UPI0023A5D839|nr:SDR family oxidoreductase [Bradyrhizobium sp.]MDE2378204.1 SDR family oxidoreductase [Bradyrhizobium sp.]